MKKLSYLLCLFGLLQITYGQTHLWTRSIGGTENEWGLSVAADANGNVYTTGTFSYTADFDPGTGTHTLSPLGEWDLFLTKLDAAGNFVWNKRIGGNHQVWSTTVEVDGAGNIFLTGHFNGVADFDPGAGTFTVNSNPLNNQDAFILKLDPSGNFLWVKTFGGKWIEYSDDIEFDQPGNLLICGSFQDTVDFDPGPSVFTLTSVGGNASGFILKLDGSGNFIWARGLRSTTSFASSGISDMSADASGDVTLTGGYTGNVDFDPGAGTHTMASVPTLFFGDSRDIFMLKLTASGAFVWAHSMGSTGGDQGRSITQDASGNLYVTGSFEATVDIDPASAVFNLTSNGGSDLFVLKMSSSGTFNWAGSFGGASLNYEHAISSELQPNGDLYLTGVVVGTVDFDPGAGVYNLSSAATDGNVFISRLTTAGNFVSARILTGSSFGMGTGIYAVSGGEVYVTGYYSGTTNFDPVQSNLTHTAVGRADVFVQKLGPVLGTGIAEANKFNHINICPNPTRGQFSLCNSGSDPETIDYKVTDQLGRLVLEGSISDGNTKVNVETLPQGVYSVHLNSITESITRKLIIR